MQMLIIEGLTINNNYIQDNHQIIANFPPTKEGAMKTIAAMIKIKIKAQHIFDLKRLPNNWPINFNGFQDHFIRPYGSGKWGYALGSLLPSPAFFLLA